MYVRNKIVGIYMNIDSIEDEKLLDIIKKHQELDLSSFSFKILLGQLKTKIDISNDSKVAIDAVRELRSYINKYGKLPNLQKDLNKIFNIQ